MTQKELGERVGKSTSAIRSYERGVFSPPDDVLAKLDGMARAAGLVDLADGLDKAEGVDRAYLDARTVGKREAETFTRFIETVPVDVAAAIMATLRALTDRYAPAGEGDGGDDGDDGA